MENQESKKTVQENVKRLFPFAIDYTKVKKFELTDDEKKEILKERKAFISVRKELLVKPLLGTIKVKSRPTFPTDLRYLDTYSSYHYPKGKMLIFVNGSIYTKVKASIDQYIMDVANEGYYATAYAVTDVTETRLRTFIRSKRPVVGALMVGNLPCALYEDPTSSELFPCDLYFMDLDGAWKDVNTNGYFDAHPTNPAPEIWLGRVWTPTENGNDVGMINEYFARNHAFRKGELGCSDKALSYVDDDWKHFNDCGLNQLFRASNVTTINDPVATDADRYKAELNKYRAFVQVCAHSNPGLHAFRVSESNEYVLNSYMRDKNSPKAFLYNLFACSAARYTTADYLGGWYIFNKPNTKSCNGLAAVGSAKTGSMLYFENFYGKMAQGKTVGEAMVEWWKSIGVPHSDFAQHWFYGMTILGDPTLSWWSGAVPKLRIPENETVFEHYPRLTHMCWEPIALDNVTYNVEVDAYGAWKSGMWAAEACKTFMISGNISGNSYEHGFAGAQRGRWRVRARIGNFVCPWSDWQYFRYTI